MKERKLICITVIACAILLFTYGVLCLFRDYKVVEEVYRSDERIRLLRENLEAIHGINWSCEK